MDRKDKTSTRAEGERKCLGGGGQIEVSEVTRKGAPKESGILDKVSKAGAARAASLDNLLQAKRRAKRRAPRQDYP